MRRIIVNCHRGGFNLEIKTPTKEERIATHVRGIKVMLMPTLVGLVAGLLSSPFFLSQPIYVNGVLTNPLVANHSPYAFVILAVLIYAQKYLFPLIGIKSSEFKFKDWFFVTFMTFCFWYIAWTIILNGPAPAFGPFF